MLSTEYLLWVGANSSIEKEYKCGLCRQSDPFSESKLGADRVCYLFGREHDELEVIVHQDVEKDGMILLKSGEKLRLSKNEIIDFIEDITDMFPKLSALDALKTVFPTVCPKSLMDQEVDGLITMESFCRDYHVPPLGSDIGYLDYPCRMIQAFAAISTIRERTKMKDIANMRAKK